MAANTKIEWCDHTFNPWIGCTKLSPACDNCYAETYDRRFGGERWGAHAPRKITSDSNWSNPLSWNRKAAREGKRFRVFCASLADVFDNHSSIQPEWRERLWKLIRETPNLDWLLLTKRPQNFKKFLPADWGIGYPNVWLGVTVENQTEANRRIPHLLNVNTALRFLSCEPLLGQLNLSELEEKNEVGSQIFDALHCDVPAEDDPEWHGAAIDWVIAGGESGAESRPSQPDWFSSLRDQCRAAHVPFFFKQWGDWVPGEFTDHGVWAMNKVGKHRATKLLEGCKHQEFPVLEQDQGAGK